MRNIPSDIKLFFPHFTNFFKINDLFKESHRSLIASHVNGLNSPDTNQDINIYSMYICIIIKGASRSQIHIDINKNDAESEKFIDIVYREQQV